MNNVTQTKLICPDCGNVFPIMRKTCNQKKTFHRKWLYCIKCNKVTNHIEIKDLEKWISEIEFKEENEINKKEKEVYLLIKKRSR